MEVDDSIVEKNPKKSEAIWEPFVTKIKHSIGQLQRGNLETLQINMGKLCNQACTHCHVDAGPNKQKENMVRKTAERILALLDKTQGVKTVDITGGAPEMNRNFVWFVTELRSRGLQVIDRCNLTVLLLPGQKRMAAFLAEKKIKLIASLPCYEAENVETQRGQGVFWESIQALKILNTLGYGVKGSGLELDLVYNPIGPNLPPSQKSLEAAYKKQLNLQHRIVFNSLLTITNMPIKRFLFELKRDKQFHSYMKLLANSFNTQAAQSVMCLTTVSISWDGFIYDCDFNQMLEMPAVRKGMSIWDVESFSWSSGKNIALADHCYGCTAGFGSSCGGAIVAL